jgi:hypothetical protein
MLRRNKGRNKFLGRPVGLIHINAKPGTSGYETDTSRKPRGFSTLKMIALGVSDPNAKTSSGSSR